MLLKKARKMPGEGEIGRSQPIDAFISSTPLYHLDLVHQHLSSCTNPESTGRLGIDLGI
jgi:hypothetical protein